MSSSENSVKKGKLFLVVGPSGVGKGTLVREIKKSRPDFFFPVSNTTRDPREGEVDGVDYNFVSNAEFEKMWEEGQLLERAVVHASCKYGLPRQQILDAVAAGKIVIREVDIQGLISIREKLDPEIFTAVFIAPPSIETLKQRILSRQPEMQVSEFAARIASAEKELSQKELADYELVSEENEIEKLLAEFLALVEKETATA